MPQRSMFGAVERPDRWENIRRLFSEVSERNLRNQLAEIEILGQQQEQERRTAMLERWRAGLQGIESPDDVRGMIPMLSEFDDVDTRRQALRELEFAGEQVVQPGEEAPQISRRIDAYVSEDGRRIQVMQDPVTGELFEEPLGRVRETTSDQIQKERIRDRDRLQVSIAQLDGEIVELENRLNADSQLQQAVREMMERPEMLTWSDDQISRLLTNQLGFSPDPARIRFARDYINKLSEREGKRNVANNIYGMNVERLTTILDPQPEPVDTGFVRSSSVDVTGSQPMMRFGW